MKEILFAFILNASMQTSQVNQPNTTSLVAPHFAAHVEVSGIRAGASYQNQGFNVIQGSIVGVPTGELSAINTPAIIVDGGYYHTIYKSIAAGAMFGANIDTKRFNYSIGLEAGSKRVKATAAYWRAMEYNKPHGVRIGLSLRVCK